MLRVGVWEFTLRFLLGTQGTNFGFVVAGIMSTKLRLITVQPMEEAIVRVDSTVPVTIEFGLFTVTLSIIGGSLFQRIEQHEEQTVVDVDEVCDEETQPVSPPMKRRSFSVHPSHVTIRKTMSRIDKADLEELTAELFGEFEAGFTQIME